jgi:hypothetical protein
LTAIRQCPISIPSAAAVLASGIFLVPSILPAQSPTAPASEKTVANPVASAPERRPDFLPGPVSDDNFAELRDRSPFLRTLNLSQSLILTGISRIGEDTVATVLDLDSKRTWVVSRHEPNLAGWQLVEVKGDQSDLESLTARIRVGGGTDVVSIRYGKSPQRITGIRGVVVSTRIGNGTAGGGTGPHGGPDPRVLTPDQLSDARNAARNIQAGFQADGYADNQRIPSEVISKVSRLSVKQRESINVKMFEYRNRGLGMPERQQIYNRLLDRELKQR